LKILYILTLELINIAVAENEKSLAFMPSSGLNSDKTQYHLLNPSPNHLLRGLSPDRFTGLTQRF
jgi:hypothetical protein